LNKALPAAAATLLFIAAAPARPQTPSAEQRFRELYKELVETNTSLSAGSCTLAAERMAARLKAAGFTDEELHLFTAPGHPREGGLVAVYPGRNAKLKAVLLLAHLDVVEAKREDWSANRSRSWRRTAISTRAGPWTTSRRCDLGRHAGALP